MNTCPACHGEVREGLRPWHLACGTCAYEGSSLEAHILDQRDGGDLDERLRGDALRVLRDRNFRTLGEWVRHAHADNTGATTTRPRLLDVGCAHGWFLELMGEHFDVTGIEPDPNVALEAARAGVDVRSGFFPDVLAGDELFDVIVFNDVLEHIPDVHATLAACRSHLKEGGLLVVNAPDRTGFLYRLSKQASRLGMHGWFDRMWQAGFPSPHVHYFDTGTISKLAGQHGFQLRKSDRLPSVLLSGLYSRIRYSKETSVATAALTTAAVAAGIPLLSVLPTDITVWIFRRS